MNRTRLFWWLTLLGWLLTASCVILAPALRPERWRAYHFLFVPGICICIIAGVIGGSRIGWRTLVISGFIQSLAMIEHFLRVFGTAIPERDTFRVVVWVIAYSGGFALFVRGISWLWPAKSDAGRCCKCSYLLYGLPEPRCPECGTPFDPKEVSEALRDTSAARPT
jgi:hypothetical protein